MSLNVVSRTADAHRVPTARNYLTGGKLWQDSMHFAALNPNRRFVFVTGPVAIVAMRVVKLTEFRINANFGKLRKNKRFTKFAGFH